MVKTLTPPTPGSTTAISVNTTLRILQIACTSAVLAIYVPDIHAALHAKAKIHPYWLYIVITSTFSLFFSLVFLLPQLQSHRFFSVDATLAFLWLVVFGMFGYRYIPEDCEGNRRCQKVKLGVWFDAALLGLWSLSAVVQFFLFCGERKRGFPKRWVDMVRGWR